MIGSLKPWSDHRRRGLGQDHHLTPLLVQGFAPVVVDPPDLRRKRKGKVWRLPFKGERDSSSSKTVGIVKMLRYYLSIVYIYIYIISVCVSSFLPGLFWGVETQNNSKRPVRKASGHPSSAREELQCLSWPETVFWDVPG